METATLITIVWLAIAVLLMLAEILLPGGVAFFLGLGGVVAATLYYFGWFGSIWTALGGWVVLSTFSFFIFMFVVLKLFGNRSSSSRESLDEDTDAIGTEVEVTQTITAADNNGRVYFRGTTWAARSLHGEIPAGRRARLLGRSNLTWIVAPVDPEEASGGA